MRILFLLCSLVCSIIMYGQIDYEVTEYDRQEDYVIIGCNNSVLPFYQIMPPHAEELMQSVCEGKSQYEGLPIPMSDPKFWINSFAQIQNAYLTASDLKNIQTHNISMNIMLIFDNHGDMKYMDAVLNSKIFDVITKEQVISMYRALWKIKVPMNNEFDNTRYYKGHISFFRYD